MDKFRDLAKKRGINGADSVRVAWTERPGHAVDLTREALRGGAGVVVCVGGDGTLAEVVEGFFVEDQKREMISGEAALGFVPAGTGGDFRRSAWDSKFSHENALARLLDGARTRLDVGYAILSSSEGGGRKLCRHWINVSSCGSSAEIARIANDSPKFLGGFLTFYQASLRGLVSYQPRMLRVRVDGGEWEALERVNALAVCNGRYFGAGMMVAPQASVSDGLLDVTVWQGFSVLDFIALTGKLYSGEHVHVKGTRTLRCAAIQVEEARPSKERCAVEMDGETPGSLPAAFEVLPACLPFIR